MYVHSNCSLQIKQTKVVKSIIDSLVMQTIFGNFGMFVLRNVFKFVHPSIQIKHNKVLKSIYCNQVPIS